MMDHAKTIQYHLDTIRTTLHTEHPADEPLDICTRFKWGISYHEDMNAYVVSVDKVVSHGLESECSLNISICDNTVYFMTSLPEFPIEQLSEADRVYVSLEEKLRIGEARVVDHISRIYKKYEFVNTLNPSALLSDSDPAEH